MNITAISSPVYSSSNNLQIDCVLTTDKGNMPFTARSDDPEPHGKKIFNDLVSGKYGTILPYVVI